MYKLLLKKSFFDGWDNILVLFLTNIFFCALILGMWFSGNLLLSAGLLFVFSFHLMGMNGAAFFITEDRGKWYEGYVKAIKKAGHLIFFYCVLLVSVYLIVFVTPFYLSQEDFLFYAAGMFVFCSAVVMIFGLMYYFPLCLALDRDGVFKTYKKCFIVLFDNFWMSVYCLLKNICDLTISVFTAFLMPGFGGVAITQNNAVCFFIKRYDWMEEKKVGKHDVSADMYLADVFEAYRERNLRTLFYPWKD